MLKLEKVKLTTGLQTDVSPKGIDTLGNRLIVNPILDVLNARYVGNSGSEFLFESVRGNVKVTNADLPGGTNKQIGAFEDIANNVLVFFLYNSLGTHGVYEYSHETGLITTLLQSSYLNFQDDPRYLITGVGVQGDLRFWSDGYNPQRCINRTRDYSAITSDKPITLIKEHPSTMPDVLGTVTIPQGHPAFRNFDVSLPTNRISAKNLQFSYQYVFVDNEKSVIAPFSKMAYASIDPTADIDSPNSNNVPFRHTIPSDVYPFVKIINLLVREGNTGTWSIWKKVHPTSAAITANYNGYEPLIALTDAEQAKIQEAVPTASKALVLHRNRVILSADRENFNVNLSSGAFPITMAITQVLESYLTNTRNTYFKRGGGRTFGIAVFDARGRSMGVFGKVNMKFTAPDDVNNGTDNFQTDTQRPYVTITLTGDLSASPEAAYISIVTTEETYYEEYMQVPVVPFFYRYENPSSSPPSGVEMLFNSRMYYKGIPNSGSLFDKIHLLLPKEAPFIPTDQFLVKLMSKRATSPFSTAKLERVQAMLESQFAVVGNFGITNWTGLTSHSSIADPLFVEIFKIRDTPSDKFFEITDRIPLVAGVPSTTSFTIYGDQYYGTITGIKFNFDVFKMETSVTPNAHTDVTPEKTCHIETPTPTYGFKSVVENEISKVVVESSGILAAVRSVFGSKVSTFQPHASSRNFILDYSKKTWNGGKPFVELDNPIELDRSNVLRFSNKYLPDSSINGLSNFDSGDEYTLPVDSTPIKKLVPVGNNILAVHERSLTTLYVEQSMIKNTQGVEQLITTDRFIGYDRALKNKVGAYNAESVQEYQGNAFGFDVYRGVVWQYTNEGAEIISDRGMADYFATKAASFLPYKDTGKVIGGIDPFYTEYIISFVFPAGQESQNVTLAYNWTKNIWTTRYSFVPEGYGRIGDVMISFKDGDLWLHDASATYNNFYGVQYERRFKIATNPYPSRSKNYMALQIATNLLTAGGDAEFKVVQCFTEDGQETYMKADDFELLEGVWYGPILKDINTLPALIEAGKIALRNGDDMLGKYLIIELINDHTTDACPIQFMNLSYTDSEYTK